MNLTDKNSESSYICWTSSDLFAGSNVEMIYGCNGDTFPSELEISKETRAASFLQARLLFLLPRHCQVAWWWRLDAVAADMIRWCWFPNVCPEWPSEVPGGRSQTSCGDSRTHKQPPCCWFQFAAFRTSALCERFVLWFKRCLFGFFLCCLVWDSDFWCSSSSPSPCVTWLPADSIIGRLLCVPASWRPLCPLPGTAYRTPRCPHSCSALLAGDHRLKPGRITDTRCLCVWCFAGTPSA